MLAREELAGAAHAGLDLVADEHHVALAADARALREITRRRHDDSALALDRLDQERGGVAARSRARARRRRRNGTCRNPAGNGPKPSRYWGSVEKPTIVIERPWKLPLHTITSARSCGMPLTLWPHLRTALSAVSTDSAPPEAGSARSSPVSCRQPLEQPRQELVVKHARRDREALRLLDQRAHDPRVRVAMAHRRVRAHHVEIAAAVLVPEPAAVAVREHDRQRIVVARARAGARAQSLRKLRWCSGPAQCRRRNGYPFRGSS